ncbi:YdcF family protein [Corynebacterium anserum]|uniref:Uncharacterized protein n=1 Tax=Corynebacterium anserum TaxID=2684406 RepID=A0A7G7YPR4_9CORY|nr:YdcF family protein [Corynebacterium anserum]MBC2682126.1 hypothetical protein [Corynebacterium anserum]QNH96484.1 hypothetical protein GP473_07285 [Corynebacterium anserum]
MKRWSGIGLVALIAAELLWCLLAILCPWGWPFAVAYVVHFVPMIVASMLSVPMLRTGDKRRWLHTEMTIAAADYFSLIFGAVVVLSLGSVPLRVVAGVGIAVWCVVLVCFILFLRRLARTRRREFHEQLDAVIVLGAGLVGKRPGPLLASRVRRAVMAVPCGVPLIMSGGRGPDERVSEAWAMVAYAAYHYGIVLGRNHNYLREETRATNTRENLRFSVQQLLASEDAPADLGAGRPLRIGVVTSDFHVQRTEMTAVTVAELLREEVEVEFMVIGSVTPVDARPSAYLREFVALMLWKARGILN